MVARTSALEEGVVVIMVVGSSVGSVAPEEVARTLAWGEEVEVTSSVVGSEAVDSRVVDSEEVDPEAVDSEEVVRTWASAVVWAEA